MGCTRFFMNIPLLDTVCSIPIPAPKKSLRCSRPSNVLQALRTPHPLHRISCFQQYHQKFLIPHPPSIQLLMPVAVISLHRTVKLFTHKTKPIYTTDEITIIMVSTRKSSQFRNLCTESGPSPPQIYVGGKKPERLDKL